MPPTGCVTFGRLLNTSLGLSSFIYKIRTDDETSYFLDLLPEQHVTHVARGGVGFPCPPTRRSPALTFLARKATRLASAFSRSTAGVLHKVVRAVEKGGKTTSTPFPEAGLVWPHLGDVPHARSQGAAMARQGDAPEPGWCSVKVSTRSPLL